MKHCVHFDNCNVTWDQALPLGNGNFGAMLFFEDDKLSMAMNHYDVYYTRSDIVFPEDFVQPQGEMAVPGHRHKLFYDRAVRNIPKDDDTPYYYFRQDVNDLDNTRYATNSFGESHPSTGELTYSFSDAINNGDRKLTLFVEDAKVSLTMEKDENSLQIDTIAARKDYIINKVTQRGKNLIDRIRIAAPEARFLDAPEICYRQIDSNTFTYTVYRYIRKDNTPFVFTGVIKLVNATGKLVGQEPDAEIIIDNSGETFYILTGIYSQWKCEDTFAEGLAAMNTDVENIDAMYSEHAEYWENFFRQSSIELPDKFIEDVYYINQYALDCCSGKDGTMYHQACGLNGLWDIRQPNIWGSRWYWDVNIQAAFAGVYSSNRLDLAKVFSDGLLSYVDLAEKFARRVHNMSGIAADFPPQSYYCIWPWSAQYLWQLYEYSLDENYLRTTAYPAFLKICEFCLQLFEYDEKDQCFHVFPDISPEQGPLAHDTTITIASVKYLFKFTLKAAQILGESNDFLDECKAFYDKLPPYALSEPSKWGVHFKDSPDAPDNLWIRHPSMLMPLFPTGEFNLKDTDDDMLKILSNTVDFLEENCEIGIFGGTWIAAAAARLGRGQTALRLIYERGIDHMLRPNGLTAEETDRFLNYCLLANQPLYYPCMMEFTGQMLAAVNEMLMQSDNGIIRIFPAIPDGDKEYGRGLRNGYALHDCKDRFTEYDAWKNVRFDRLLARGAFEVSASLSDGAIEWVSVTSQKGGAARITSPFDLSKLSVYCDGAAVEFSVDSDVIYFETQEGKTYTLAQSADYCLISDTENTYMLKPLSRLSYTKRKLFIGGDRDSAYHNAMNGFLRDWYLGNVRMENNTVRRFDFSTGVEKDYAKSLPSQAFEAEQMLHLAAAFHHVTANSGIYSTKIGYGFTDMNSITAVDRGGDDEIRRDFLTGTDTVEFVINAPRGQYEFLIISHDSAEDCVTMVDAVNGLCDGGDVISAGDTQSLLIPVIQKKDVPVRLRISTKPGYAWKINAVFMNMIKGY